MSLKEQISSDLKDAMRARDKQTLEALRLVMAAIKQVEVDERIELDDSRIIAILDKLSKQRNESISQFKKANREDLVLQEEFELNLISKYLPEPLSEKEILEHIEAAIAATGASEMRDMGKVMAYLKGPLQGRADMSLISAKIKEKLNV
ncbi:MAG: glutamyl-tRNA amidotransferase [Legionellales bacterium RIFCSPHIGHO2_12_FULL_42_9]|nr:MAG: glutamyl-tRNA amidotransferase [Legionellales bacterium RIFCSPHIGHO2_12_FULL_42_9]